MTALSLGIIAAVCWGIHDVCVRYVSQRTNIFAALFLVVLSGTILLTPIMLSLGSGTLPDQRPLMLSTASGLAFAVAGIALYKAFSMGPVRLVAPIIGAYPILSMAWAAMSGAQVTLLQWTAVLAVIGGIALVATQSRNKEEAGAPFAVIVGWSIAASVGWALTFAFGQAATLHGDPYDLLLITRMVTTLALLPVLMLTGATLNVGGRALIILSVLGLLDATALAMILLAGTMPRPEYASVAASTFGIVTILLAWGFLREDMRPLQWLGVFVAFWGIGYLAI